MFDRRFGFGEPSKEQQDYEYKFGLFLKKNPALLNKLYADAVSCYDTYDKIQIICDRYFGGNKMSMQDWLSSLTIAVPKELLND